jgi:hypothetical protein
MGLLIWCGVVDGVAGVGAFAIIGAHCGLRRKMPYAACVLFGLMTATFGGITRDVICQRPVRVLHNNREQCVPSSAIPPPADSRSQLRNSLWSRVFSGSQ